MPVSEIGVTYLTIQRVDFAKQGHSAYLHSFFCVFSSESYQQGWGENPPSSCSIICCFAPSNFFYKRMLQFVIVRFHQERCLHLFITLTIKTDPWELTKDRKIMKLCQYLDIRDINMKFYFRWLLEDSIE